MFGRKHETDGRPDTGAESPETEIVGRDQPTVSHTVGPEPDGPFSSGSSAARPAHHPTALDVEQVYDRQRRDPALQETHVLFPAGPFIANGRNKQRAPM
jgi:hypothetical protein